VTACKLGLIAPIWNRNNDIFRVFTEKVFASIYFEIKCQSHILSLLTSEWHQEALNFHARAEWDVFCSHIFWQESSQFLYIFTNLLSYQSFISLSSLHTLHCSPGGISELLFVATKKTHEKLSFVPYLSIQNKQKSNIYARVPEAGRMTTVLHRDSFLPCESCKISSIREKKWYKERVACVVAI